MQRAAARALEAGDAWLERTRALYREAGARAAAALGVAAPEAGTFLALDAAPCFAPGEDLGAFLGRCLDAGVLVTPGAAIGRDYASWIRICFTAVPPEQLDDAIARLARVLGR
jgi:N-succinyldiaminopimelate aminotransferase